MDRLIVNSVILLSVYSAPELPFAGSSTCTFVCVSGLLVWFSFHRSSLLFIGINML